MFWHNFFWPHDSEYILMHLLSKYYNTNMICSTDTQYVSTQSWFVLQTHNILQYYHDLFGRFVQNIKNRMCIFWVSKRNYYIFPPKVITKAIIIIVGNSLIFSYLASHSEWRCLRCLSCRWYKTENIHVDLALWVWGPTLLSTHAPLPHKLISP